MADKICAKKEVVILNQDGIFPIYKASTNTQTITCNQLVCSECITASHKKHDLDSIDIVFNEKKEKLKELESKFSNKFNLCEIEDRKVNEFKTKYEQMFTESIQKINEQEKLIIDEVRKYAKTLREQLDSEKQSIEKSITEIEKRTEKVMETLLNKQSIIQEILESNQAVQVFGAYQELSGKEIPNASFKAFPEETKDFIPAKENLKAISNLFGSLTNTKLPKVLTHVNIDVISSYTTDQTALNRVLIEDEKKAWISNHMTSSLSKIHIADTMKTVKDIPVDVLDMSMTGNNDVLLSSYGSTDVSLLSTKTGEIKPFLSMSPLYPLGIHVTKYNEIILGVKEEGDIYKITDKICRKVKIFGVDGKHKQSYEYDKHKQRLFTVPYRITSNLNNAILVIDRTSDYNGRVVVMDREGQVEWIYQGNPHVNLI
ncbi:unnamed protein product [Mytilus edulis]|uniref:B box-type domain-containing protein n=1 Tax=Mytilus edulis TaxID=6550 RepID=A0A8S3TE32_MYTED|nr:unnamed protein product [Mytilus edulis]